MRGSARHHLAKLTAGHQSFDTAVGTGTGPELDWSLVAAAVGHIRRKGPDGHTVPDRFTQDLLLYVWAGAHVLKPDLMVGGLARLNEMAKRGNDRYHWVARAKHTTTFKLLGVGLSEMLAPIPCRECSASGRARDRVGKEIPCEHCLGAGRFLWPQARRAREYGCSPPTWQQSHRERYLTVQSFLRNREAAGLGRVMRALRD